uniref:cAMP-dependent protein kinase inhibitor n=1 Tax=Acrobeloides nanus TaxID=290746 RepID=A0A914DPS1_9BILA
MGELETVQAVEQLQQFIASGRSGRRNAMPEIVDINCLDPEAQKLAEKLSQLNTSSEASTSGSNEVNNDESESKS